MAAHPNADHADFRHIRVGQQRFIAKLPARLFQHILRARQINLADGECHIRAAIGADVLHDHVHIHIGLGERAKNGGGHTGPVRHTAKRYLGVIARIGDAGNDGLFHDFILINHERAWLVFKAGKHLHAHTLLHRQFNRTRLQDLGANGREFKHFLIGNPLKLAGARHNARVGRIDAIHIGIDITAIRLHGSGDGHRRKIRPTAAKRGDAVAFRVNALKPRHHRHLALLHAFNQGCAINAFNPRLAMRLVRDDRHLPALPGPRINANRLERNGGQARCHLLTGCDHRVIFARIMQRG